MAQKLANCCAEQKTGDRYKTGLKMKRKESVSKPNGIVMENDDDYEIPETLIYDIKTEDETLPVVQQPTSTSHFAEISEAVALVDYKAQEKDELSFKKGEHLEVVVTRTKLYWNARSKKTGQCGLVNGNNISVKNYNENKSTVVIQRSNSCESWFESLFVYAKPWFKGQISVDEAAHMLCSEKKAGAFLIRQIEDPVYYYLSVRYNKNTCKHYGIKRNSSKKFYIFPEDAFSTLQELIQFYSENQGRLCCQLTSSWETSSAANNLSTKDKNAPEYLEMLESQDEPTEPPLGTTQPNGHSSEESISDSDHVYEAYESTEFPSRSENPTDDSHSCHDEGIYDSLQEEDPEMPSEEYDYVVGGLTKKADETTEKLIEGKNISEPVDLEPEKSDKLFDENLDKKQIKVASSNQSVPDDGIKSTSGKQVEPGRQNLKVDIKVIDDSLNKTQGRSLDSYKSPMDDKRKHTEQRVKAILERSKALANKEKMTSKEQHCIADVSENTQPESESGSQSFINSIPRHSNAHMYEVSDSGSSTDYAYSVDDEAASNDWNSSDGDTMSLADSESSHTWNVSSISDDKHRVKHQVSPPVELSKTKSEKQDRGLAKKNTKTHTPQRSQYNSESDPNLSEHKLMKSYIDMLPSKSEESLHQSANRRDSSVKYAEVQKIKIRKKAARKSHSRQYDNASDYALDTEDDAESHVLDSHQDSGFIESPFKKYGRPDDSMQGKTSGNIHLAKVHKPKPGRLHPKSEESTA